MFYHNKEQFPDRNVYPEIFVRTSGKIPTSGKSPKILVKLNLET